MSRAFQLYLIEIRSVYHRLRYDLGREVVVGICSVVLVGLFGYVFNDLLNREIAAISSSARNVIGKASSLILLIVVASLWGHNCRSVAQNCHPLQLWLRRIGENDRTIQRFGYFRVLSSGAVLFAMHWWISMRYLTTWPLTHAVSLQVAVLLFGWSWMKLVPPTLTKQMRPFDAKHSLGASTIQVMVAWRWRQMIHRNRIIRIALGVGSLYWVLGTVAFALRAAPLTVLICGFLGGVLAAFGLFSQIAEDMKAAWAERSMGISHENIISTYKRLARRLIPIPLLLFPLANIWLGPEHAASWVLALQFGAAAMTPLALAPGLMFQIDVHRPLLQVLTLGMIGIFIATAIYAHIAAVLLIPLFNYYSEQFQMGRYYRA